MVTVGSSSAVQDLVSEIADGVFSWDPAIGTLAGYGTYDDRLGTFTPEAVRAMVESCQGWLAQIQRAVGADLHRDDRADLVALEAMLDGQITELESVRLWERSPYWYGERIIFGLWGLLINDRDAHETCRNLISRLGEVGGLLDQARTNLVRPLRSAVESTLESSASAARLLTSLGSDLGVSERERAELAQAGARAVGSWQGFCQWLESDVLPVATDDPQIPTAAYERLLSRFHGLDMSAAELLAVGTRQVSAISQLLREQARTIRGDDDWRAALDDTSVDCPEAEELLATYRRDVARTIDFLEQRRLVTLPPDELLVEETPAFGRTLFPFAAYLGAGPFSAENRPGRFWVTPFGDKGPDAERLQKAHNVHSRLLLALHEGYPGHHLQLAISRRVGRKARWLAEFPTFIEGWAFYCEQMMFEQGFLFEPGGRLWQLRDELWRAARIVVDASYHSHGMSVADGQRYLVDEVGMEPEHALAEARWYAGRPSYPMSYMMGKQQLLSLRQDFLAQRRGSLCEFHDRLLATGGLPIRLAAERVLS